MSDEDGLTETFKLRCTPEQKAVWDRIAKRSGRSLSNWMRYILNQEAERFAEPPQSPAKGGKRKG